jgi:SAM-dependent methyltransferase
MLRYVLDVIDAVEQSARSPSLASVLPQLRQGLGLDDFGELMISMPMAQFPNLSLALPKMASAEVQNQWTGNNGIPLLRQSTSFVRSAVFNYMNLTGKTLSGASILDYGCGYGRLARLMYYFTDPDRLFGVDPWDRSISECQEAGLGANFRLSDYLPNALPVPGPFDFLYAFSVFTHTSLRATKAALEVCRRYIADDGIMFITIRPVEYWTLDRSVHGLDDVSSMIKAHEAHGFTFSPFDLPPVDGDITYGNTSMTVEWIESNIPQWQVAAVDRSLDDAYQIYVALKPVYGNGFQRM